MSLLWRPVSVNECWSYLLLATRHITRNYLVTKEEALSSIVGLEGLFKET